MHHCLHQRAAQSRVLYDGACSGVRRLSIAVKPTDISFQRPRYSPITPPTTTSTALPQAALRHQRPVRAPNANLRSPIHNVDLSARLGVKLSRPVVGAQEWQTSAYHYNRATEKNFPVAAHITNKMLEHYVTARPKVLDRDGNPMSARKSELNQIRKDEFKPYVSDSTVKDFGDRIVIDAYVHTRIKEEAEGTNRKRRPRR